MSRNYEFVQLDVFTKKPLTGNPLAVFPDARGLTSEEMQALAREMNLSETTFIVPRDAEVERKEGKRVRIFTVEEELPFAGHPTLGTALYLYHLGSSPVNELTLDLNVGKIAVRFDPEVSHKAERVDGNIYAEMRQRDPDFGAVLSPDKMNDVLGKYRDAIALEWPCQVVSTGLPFAIVPIRDATAFAQLRPDLLRADAVLEGSGARFIYFICPQRRNGRLQVGARMFFYGGEDPATGSAAGCAASWMVYHGVANTDERVVIRQGVEAGRASELVVRASRTGDRVTNVRVGGHAVEVLRGVVTL
jgi:trans-2,3-dihydro-3-hydroxyanthranilate isomerase